MVEEVENKKEKKKEKRKGRGVGCSRGAYYLKREYGCKRATRSSWTIASALTSISDIPTITTMEEQQVGLILMVMGMAIILAVNPIQVMGLIAEVLMEKSSESYVPTAVMVYAVISEPSIVDNPDVPSYQSYVHGRCDPPALILLHMHKIEMEVDCYLDTAFVTVSGTWRVHCVMSSKSCDCRIMIPMSDHGSVLGVEVDDGRRSYHTQLIPMEDAKDSKYNSQSQRWVPTKTADIQAKSSPS